MNKTFSFSLFAFLTILVLSPFTTHAYGTSEQTAVRLSDTHVLFTITYKLGFLNRESSLPILANTTKDADISFIITDENNSQTSNNSQSIVLTDKATLENNRYYLNKGESSDFTLIAIVEIPKSETGHSLQITNLPFITTDENNQFKLGKVDENTLTDFKTPFVK